MSETQRTGILKLGSKIRQLFRCCVCITFQRNEVQCLKSHLLSRLESLQNAQGSSSSPLYERFTSVQNARGRNPPRGTNFPVWATIDFPASSNTTLLIFLTQLQPFLACFNFTYPYPRLCQTAELGNGSPKIWYMIKLRHP